MFEKLKDTHPDESTSIQIPEARRERPPGGDFNPRNAAVIGTTIKIKGKVSGEENLVIEGQVDGSVDLPGHDLTVGQKGQVKADLRARTVKAEGQITGDITGSEKVVVTKTGRVLGNITAPRVTLEDGAKFKGSIDMDPALEATEKATPPRTTAKEATATEARAREATAKEATASEARATKATASEARATEARATKAAATKAATTKAPTTKAASSGTERSPGPIEKSA